MLEGSGCKQSRFVWQAQLAHVVFLYSNLDELLTLKNGEVSHTNLNIEKSKDPAVCQLAGADLGCLLGPVLCNCPQFPPGMLLPLGYLRGFCALEAVASSLGSQTAGSAGSSTDK